MREAGYPDFVVTGWLGFFIRSQTPPDVLKKLQDNLIAVLNEPEIKNKFLEMGGIPGGRPQADFDKFVKDEVSRWGDVITRAKLSLD
jgi:tripartite-type tricarboxylate transporter receptor subunit TctC